MGFFDGFVNTVKDIGGAMITGPTQGALNVLGGITGQSAADANSASQASAQNAMNFSQASADKQMAFQERLSNSAYQRGMKDMEAAGLNPMLAMSMGGASSPSGASASGQAVQMQDVGGAALKNISNLAGAGKDLGSLPASISQMKASAQQSQASAAQTEALTPALKQKAESETLANTATALETDERKKNYTPQRKKLNREAQKLLEEIKSAKTQAEKSERLNKWQREHPSLYDAGQTLDTLKGGVDAIKAVPSLKPRSPFPKGRRLP